MTSPDARVFVISVAAELAGMHPQTLRQYDRLGIVSPGRTRGRGRRYSLRDVATLREVQRLSQEEGVSLSGIKIILELRAELERLTAEVERLRLLTEAGRRVFTVGPEGDVEVVPRAKGASRFSRGSGALVLWRPSGR